MPRVCSDGNGGAFSGVQTRRPGSCESTFPSADVKWVYYEENLTRNTRYDCERREWEGQIEGAILRHSYWRRMIERRIRIDQKCPKTISTSIYLWNRWSRSGREMICKVATAEGLAFHLSTSNNIQHCSWTNFLHPEKERGRKLFYHNILQTRLSFCSQ